jgi:putative colanic acid biosysnthesis UDP-glucose lipid carrier transferase
MALRRRTIVAIVFFIDLLALNASFGLTSLWHYNELIGINDLFYLLNGSWALVFIYFLNEKFFTTEGIRDRITSLIKQVLLYLFLGSFVIVILNKDDISRTMFLGSTLAFFGLKALLILPYSYLVAHRKDGGYFNKILVVGYNKIGKAIQTYYRVNLEKGRVVGFLDDHPLLGKNQMVLGSLSDFQRVFDKAPFNEVVISLDFDQSDLIKEIVKLAEFNGVRPSVVANNYALFARNFDVRDIGGIPTLQVREVPLESYVPRIQKRLFDVVFSVVMLLLASPFLLLIAIAIKLDSKGPVFYKPVRVGKRGKPISIFKFRSMKNDHGEKTKSTSLNDDRITKVGRLIRKASLDEFPQFINVLLGDMSVVGPRPHRLDLNKRFQVTAQGYMVRQYIKPGITGWAQVNGWRGPTETKFQYIARTLHDLWYLEHWTFALDIYIIFLTIFGKKTRTNAF